MEIRLEVPEGDWKPAITDLFASLTPEQRVSVAVQTVQGYLGAKWNELDRYRTVLDRGYGGDRDSAREGMRKVEEELRPMIRGLYDVFVPEMIKAVLADEGMQKAMETFKAVAVKDSERLLHDAIMTWVKEQAAKFLTGLSESAEQHRMTYEAVKTLTGQVS